MASSEQRPEDGTPFPFEGPVPPALLIDRGEELRLLARRAADRVNVRLIAPRRYGKTSVLRAHAAALRETEWKTVRVDFSGLADLADVARRFADAYQHLDPRWIRSNLSGLLSRLGVTLSPAGPGLSIGPRPQSAMTDTALEAILRMLDMPAHVWERERTPTLVIYDEFQDLLVARKGLDGLLRSRIQHHGAAAAYVFAGSEPSMMRELFDNRERPFYAQADPVGLGPLPLEETVDELSARYESEKLDPGGCVADLAVFAGGHPQRTMLLSYLLADRLSEGAEPTPALSSEVVDDAVTRLAAGFAALVRSLGASELAVLAGVADGKAPTSQELAEGHQLSRNTLNAAANRLADQGHLIRADRSTRLVDPLLAEWLRRR